jgi:hypothetical protein
MANPTAQVQMQYLDWGQDSMLYLPFPAATADTFYPGEMVGMQLTGANAGYACHCDDTQAVLFMGIFNEKQRYMGTGVAAQPAPILLPVRRPRRFTMPLLSGTAKRPDDLRKLAYAADSGHVQLTPTGLVNANCLGRVFDILGASHQPEDLTGALSVWIEPLELQQPYGQAGYGNATFRGQGIIYSNVTAAGNGVDTTEDTLHTYSVPANTLAFPGQAIRVRGWGTFAANANNKTLKVYWGATNVYSSGVLAANNTTFYYEMLVLMQSAGNQLVVFNGQVNSAIVTTTLVTATLVETAANIVKSTGTSGTAAANNISETAFIVESLN